MKKLSVVLCLLFVLGVSSLVAEPFSASYARRRQQVIRLWECRPETAFNKECSETEIARSHTWFDQDAQNIVRALNSIGMRIPAATVAQVQAKVKQAATDEERKRYKVIATKEGLFLEEENK